MKKPFFLFLILCSILPSLYSLSIEEDPTFNLLIQPQRIQSAQIYFRTYLLIKNKIFDQNEIDIAFRAVQSSTYDYEKIFIELKKEGFFSKTVLPLKKAFYDLKRYDINFLNTFIATNPSKEICFFEQLSHYITSRINTDNPFNKDRQSIIDQKLHERAENFLEFYKKHTKCEKVQCRINSYNYVNTTHKDVLDRVKEIIEKKGTQIEDQDFQDAVLQASQELYPPFNGPTEFLRVYIKNYIDNTNGYDSIDRAISLLLFKNKFPEASWNDINLLLFKYPIIKNDLENNTLIKKFKKITFKDMKKFYETGLQANNTRIYQQLYPNTSLDELILNFKFKHAVAIGSAVTIKSIIDDQSKNKTFPSIIYNKDSRGISPLDILIRQKKKSKPESNEKNVYKDIKELLLKYHKHHLEKLKKIIHNGTKEDILNFLMNLKNTDILNLSLLKNDNLTQLMSRINPPNFHCFIASGAKIEKISVYTLFSERGSNFLKDIAYTLGKKIVPVGNGFCYVFDSWKAIKKHIEYLEINKKIEQHDKLLLGVAAHSYSQEIQVNDSKKKSSYQEITQTLSLYSSKYHVGAVLHSCFIGEIIEAFDYENKNICMIASSKYATSSLKNPIKKLFRSKSGDNFFNIFQKTSTHTLISGLPYPHENDFPNRIDSIINDEDIYSDDLSKAQRQSCLDFKIP